MGATLRPKKHYAPLYSKLHLGKVQICILLDEKKNHFTMPNSCTFTGADVHFWVQTSTKRCVFAPFHVGCKIASPKCAACI